jgi:hypothetical protein
MKAGEATQDAVFESIDDGKIAIENSRKMLETLEQLLGNKEMVQESDENGSDPESDIWISGSPSRSRKRSQQGNMNSKTTPPSKDIWSLLDGQLGVINREEYP